MEWLFYPIPFANIPSSSTPTYDPGAELSLSVISDVNARTACCSLPRMSTQVNNSSWSSKSMYGDIENQIQLVPVQGKKRTGTPVPKRKGLVAGEGR
jgi:hypothetical protein